MILFLVLMYYTRKCSRTELCTHLLPVDTSQSGTSPELFVRDILDRNSIEYETNTRKVIGPKELPSPSLGNSAYTQMFMDWTLAPLP